MPYTLMKGLAWVLLAVLLGVVVGWLLRSVAAKRQVDRARAHNLDNAELERLRIRVANLEPVVAERDRLRAELDACRAERRETTATGAGEPAAAVASVGEAAAGAPEARGPDLAAAAAVLGTPIELDDLQVVEGIGPKVAELCHGIGIHTWLELSTTEVSLLRTMLADAGPRFRTHDPTTWPEQAALLAGGRWSEFVELTGRLRGGRAVD